jgi:hypothetical protein
VSGGGGDKSKLATLGFQYIAFFASSTQSDAFNNDLLVVSSTDELPAPTTHNCSD